MPEDKQWSEAQEQFGKMLRWTEQPKDQQQAEKTTFMGEQIQGSYRNKRTGVGQNDSNVYEVELASGELVSFWGSSLIDGKFDKGGPHGGAIPVGSEIRVTYLGRVQPKTAGGRSYDNFRIEWAPGQMREAAPAQAANNQGQAALPQYPGNPAPAQPVQPPAQPAPTPQNQGY